MNGMNLTEWRTERIRQADDSCCPERLDDLGDPRRWPRAPSERDSPWRETRTIASSGRASSRSRRFGAPPDDRPDCRSQAAGGRDGRQGSGFETFDHSRMMAYQDSFSNLTGTHFRFGSKSGRI
jgi:hypothetical protein